MKKIKKYWETIWISSLCTFALVSFVWGVVAAAPVEPIQSQQTIIVKPATPKIVRHKWFLGENAEEELDRYVSQCIKDGYIIKCVTASTYSQGHFGNHYVVAEKY